MVYFDIDSTLPQKHKNKLTKHTEHNTNVRSVVENLIALVPLDINVVDHETRLDITVFDTNQARDIATFYPNTNFQYKF